MPLVEASLPEALRRAHATLLDDLRQLELAVQPTAGVDLEEVRGRLGATRTCITAHFRFEEQDGYMDAARKREPRLERAIDHLAAEHHELSQSLDALVAEAQTAPTLNEGFRDKVRGWIERVGKHELRENDLVQDAFNLDLAAED